jgi:hypothetical protein
MFWHDHLLSTFLTVLFAALSAQITVGEEGFFVDGSPYVKYNPSGTPSNVLPGWSGRVGQVWMLINRTAQLIDCAINRLRNSVPR